MQLKQTIRRGLALALMMALPLTSSAVALNEAIDIQVDTDIAAQQSQQKIDKLADQTTDMLAEYRYILHQTQSLKAYNDQLEKLVSSQRDEIESIALQLENIETTQRDIVPLMTKMIQTLEQFVALDIPFLQEERNARILALKTMMDRADVSLSEKYRRIMEAYQVETEYGRTIEAYQANIDNESGNRTVDFLRVGRVGLYYVTLDRLEAGIWDAQLDQWKTLPDDAIKAITDGLKVARKQLPPDLMVLPFRTLGGVQ